MIRRGQAKHGVLQGTLDIVRASATPDTIASIVAPRRGTGQIPHAHRYLRGLIVLDRLLVDMTILIPQPEPDLGHGTFTLARNTSVESVVEGDGAGEQRLEVEAHGGLGERVDAAVVPERAELSSATLQQGEYDYQDPRPENGSKPKVGSHRSRSGEE